MTDTYRSYTGAERGRRALLVARELRQAVAGPEAVDPRIDARIARIDAAAAERGERQALALLRQDEQAKNELAAAQARLRAARGSQDRKTARETRRAAEQRVRDTERAVRRAGI